MKKLFAILLSLSMLLALAACGDSGPADPNCGVYVGDSVTAYGITMDAKDVFDGDLNIELKAGGKAVLSYSGSTQRMNWTLNGTAFHAEGGGESLDGTLSGGVLTIPDFGGTGMGVTFVNRDYVEPAGVSLPGAATDKEPEPAATEQPAVPQPDPTPEPTPEPTPVVRQDFDPAWWEGKWYGWGVYYLADGDYAELEDQAWDAVADITINGDKGTFTLYDVNDMETPELEASVRFEAGLTDNGKMVCLNGVFMEDIYRFGEGEWEVDPASEPEGDLEHTFLLTFVYEDDAGSVRVCYVLRPWGMLWDDVENADTSEMLYDNMMPTKYEDWYLPQLGTSSGKPAPTGEMLPFEEITVIDNDECLVKITGLDPDNMWGFTLKVYLENRSSDTTYMFTLKDASVNGVNWDPFFAAEVAPGKKLNNEINFYDDDLTALLPVFTDVELSFRVYDSDDWSAPDVANETIHVYPYGKDKATTFVRTPQAGDKVLVDNDDITVIVTGFEHDDFWGYTMKLFLVNKTDNALMFSAKDVSVNGFMCDPYWATTVGAGKMKFSTAYWSDSDFEDNSITEVEEIEMTIRAYDYDTWGDVFDFKQTVTVEP